MITFNYEIFRKVIHLSSAIIPLFYYNYSKELTLLILIPITIIFLIFDILRIKNSSVKNIYNIFFKGITRSKEDSKLTGASYVFMSSTIMILLFNKELAIISLLIMSISDSLAAIVGRKFGVIKIKNKTLEGAISFFISSLIIISFFKDIIFLFAFISILSSTLAELLFNRLNDNLTIPLAFAGTYLILILLFSNWVVG